MTNLRTLAAAVLVLALLHLGVSPSDAKASRQWGAERARAEGLTRDLVSLTARYHLGAQADKPRLLAQLTAAAASRRQALLRLVEEDAGEVLRVAVPAALRAGVPPGPRQMVEEQVEMEGTVEVLHEDYHDGHRNRYFLDVAAERLSLQFAARPPAVRSGARVRVRGLRLDGTLALASGGSGSVQLLSSVLPDTFGEQRTLVILVNFQNRPVEPYTRAYAANVVFNTTNAFYLENSYGQTWLAGDVVGWYTIPLDSSVCDSFRLATLAKQAAQGAGVNLSAYRRYIYAFPQNACAWWGQGSIGGNPSQAWVNGSFQLQVVGHELGHNFGLYHSHSLDCGPVALGTSCTASDYGDTLDIMGFSTGHLNAFQKERLGWLGHGASPALITVEGDGSYWLDVYEPLGSAPKALKILKSNDPATGKRTWYYVEYRQPVGFDGFLVGNANVRNGVVIRTGSESSGNSSYLLDMTPLTSSWSDPALPFGSSFSDPDTGTTITPVAPSGGGALVSVGSGSIECVPAAPTVALSPSESQWLAAGTPLTYTASVTNRDSGACAASTFDVGAVVPEGWPAILGAAALTLHPGASASATLRVTSAPAADDGFYTVSVTATRSGTSDVGSASATYIVVESLEVTAAANRATYTRPQTVSITATVAAGGTPVAGALVNVRVRKPNGAVLKASATTGAAGAVFFQLRLRRQDPPGTYAVTVSASLNGALSGSASSSFAVK